LFKNKEVQTKLFKQYSKIVAVRCTLQIFSSLSSIPKKVKSGFFFFLWKNFKLKERTFSMQNFKQQFGLYSPILPALYRWGFL